MQVLKNHQTLVGTSPPFIRPVGLEPLTENDATGGQNVGYFEGVCETHVILTPGACGSGAPNSTSCHHFGGIRMIRM